MLRCSLSSVHGYVCCIGLYACGQSFLGFSICPLTQGCAPWAVLMALPVRKPHRCCCLCGCISTTHTGTGTWSPFTSATLTPRVVTHPVSTPHPVPHAAVANMPNDRHQDVCRTLISCRLFRSLDHAVRLVGHTCPPDDETDLKLPPVLDGVPHLAVQLWEITMRAGSWPAGLGSPVGRADGGGARQAAEVQVAAAKELCGVLVSHAKLVGALSERVLSGSAAIQSPLAAACRETRDAAGAKTQVQEGNGCGCRRDASLEGGESVSGGSGSTAGGGPEGSDCSGSGGGSWHRVLRKLMIPVLGLNLATQRTHGRLSLLVDGKWLAWAISMLTGKPRQSAAVQYGAADPAALAVLRGAVSQHASAACGAAVAQLVAHRVLRPAIYSQATAALMDVCASGADGEDARLEVKLMATIREGFNKQEAAALGWAMQTLALLLPALTLTHGSAAHVPRGWHSALDVRGALGTCCAAAGVAKRRADGAAWAAAAGGAGGVGGQGSGEGGQLQIRLQETMEVKPLCSGCCAVLDCALRLAVREDTAGELVTWAQEAVRSGGAGLQGQGEAAAGPAEAEAGAGAAVGGDDFGMAEWGEQQLGLTEAVGMLQAALAALGLEREAGLAARLGAVVAAAGEAVAAAAEPVAAGALAAGAAALPPAGPDVDVGPDGPGAEGFPGCADCGTSGAGGAEAADGGMGVAGGQGGDAAHREQQHKEQLQQHKRREAVDAFRRQARELLTAFSALPSFPYSALGLHTPSSNSRAAAPACSWAAVVAARSAARAAARRAAGARAGRRGRRRTRRRCL